MLPLIAAMTSASSSSSLVMAPPRLSQRILRTDEPIIVQMYDILKGNPNVLSLGQGIVHWLPPESAVAAAHKFVDLPESSAYGVDDGKANLKAALVEKIRRENGLLDSSVMVTVGAQQAFLNIVLATCDPEDAIVLFIPYYFNHLMALQMSGVTNFVYGKCDPSTLYPDPEWLEEAMEQREGRSVPKVVVVVNPCNPTGVLLPNDHLVKLSEICRKAGAWFVVDNTYEYFAFGGRKHTCVEGSHAINIFSFSKAYGMMGWRVGYIAYPNSSPGLFGALMKVQDSVPICANLVAQEGVLAALREGPHWVRERVGKLQPNLEAGLDALSPLGKENVKGGEGAIYLWGQLPPQFSDDKAVVKWLVKRHAVGVVPGSACGCPGGLRVAFANLEEDVYRVAAARLKQGLKELLAKGMVEDDA